MRRSLSARIRGWLVVRAVDIVAKRLRVGERREKNKSGSCRRCRCWGVPSPSCQSPWPVTSPRDPSSSRPRLSPHTPSLQHQGSAPSRPPGAHSPGSPSSSLGEQHSTGMCHGAGEIRRRRGVKRDTPSRTHTWRCAPEKRALKTHREQGEGMKGEKSSTHTERERGVCTQMCCSLMMLTMVWDSQPYSSPCSCALLPLVPAQGTWLSRGTKPGATSSGDTQGLIQHISELLSAQRDPPRVVSHAHCWLPRAAASAPLPAAEHGPARVSSSLHPWCSTRCAPLRSYSSSPPLPRPRIQQNRDPLPAPSLAGG